MKHRNKKGKSVSKTTFLATSLRITDP